MSRELIESILSGDYVSANELFEQRLSDIREKKLYESKRMFSANRIDEVMGGKTPEQVKAKPGYKGRASDVLGPSPYDMRNKITKKPVLKRKAAPAGTKTTKDTRPGVIKRNINTLMGRKPGYVKPKTPEDEKGGRVGTAVRATGKGIGKAWGVWSNVLRSGMGGPLEE